MLGRPSFLFMALVARSRELRNIEDWRVEFSEKIFEDDVTGKGGTPLIMSRPGLPWLE